MSVQRGEECSHCGRYNSRHLVANGIVVKGGKMLLIKRGIEPEIGKWALPGGYMDWDETIEEAMVREVKEETGIDATVRFMVGIYSNPKRRNDINQNVSATFALTPKSDILKPQESEIQEIRWFDIQTLPEEMAFDHAEMIKDYLKSRLRTSYGEARKEEEHGD